MKNENLSEEERKKLESIRKKLYEIMVLYNMVFTPNGRDYLVNTPKKDRFNEITGMLVEQVVDLLPLVAPYSVTLAYAANIHMGLVNLVDNILYGIDVKQFDLNHIDVNPELYERIYGTSKKEPVNDGQDKGIGS